MTDQTIVCQMADCRSTDILGIEVQGVYDGILFWKCRSCNRTWPRFFEGRLNRIANELLMEWGS